MKAIAPNGKAIIGTAELTPGTALISEGSWVLNKDGVLEFEFLGETEMDWDGQYTKETPQGRMLFVDEDGNEWPDDEIKLVEDDGQ